MKPAQNELLAIDTTFTFKVNDGLSERENSFYGALSTPPTKLSNATSVYEPISRPATRPSTNVRARNEARKLVSHVLLQLANRRKPPAVSDALVYATHTCEETSFGALSLARGPKPEAKTEGISLSQDDASDDEQQTFSTDDTINLVIQLEDVLATSIAQGWQIFDESASLYNDMHEDSSKLSFRLSRNSGKPKRSRSSSPSKISLQIPELLSLCIYVLGSIVSEDCRYKVALPRPSRPPNTLQALTLNIAQFLAYAHHNNSQVISQIAFTMIPAFSTFDLQMHPRLLNFFESGIIWPVLVSLKQLQGHKNLPVSLESRSSTASDPFDDKNPPPVSIKIEEVQSDEIPLQASRSSTSAIGRIQSANHPHQTPQVYHLTSIFSPLLSAIFDSMETRNTNGDVVVPSRLLNLLRGIMNSRTDLYNDLLEIIASRGSKARRLAIACLANFWPRAVGHSTISGPFHPIQPQIRASAHSHQFCLWLSGKSTPDSDNSHDNCRSCFQRIAGFCLRCTLCLTSVHIDCYDLPDGNAELQYSMADGSRRQRIAMYRFSHIQPNGDATRGSMVTEGHHLLPTNWFTLCLCVVCRQPLLGIHNQGLRCDRCFIPLHFNCQSSISNHGKCKNFLVTSNDITVDWEVIRQSCLDHFPFLRATKEQLQERSYEEILVCRDALRTQLQILLNGVVMGSLVISNARASSVPEFELHRVIEFCDQLSESGSLRCGSLTKNYQQHMDNAVMSSAMFDRCYLEYVTASIKASPSTALSSTALLSVDYLYDDQDESAPSFPYECVPLSHIRSVLATDFAVHNDDVALLLINQLQQHAFLDRKVYSFLPFTNFVQESSAECIFSLPLGIDLSPNVEILVSAIESCLGDLDLSTNEFGFLLLTRRFWPSGLAPEQGLTRLASRIITWILDEDEKLAVILREYVAKRSNLPGMRTASHPQIWPLRSDGRLNSPNLSSHGGDFVVARHLILSRYALPWLLEFHNLDSDLYDRIAFQSCLRMVDDQDLEQITSRNEELLRGVIKLCSSSVSFTTFESLLSRTIKHISGTDVDQKPSPYLYKVFSDENEVSQRGTTFPDIQQDRPSPISIDSFKVLLDLARRQSPDGLPQCLAVLPVLIKSGITISTLFFREILELIQPTNPDFLEHCQLFIRSLTFSLWLRSLGRQDLQPIIASLHSRLLPQIHNSLSTGRDVSVVLSIIRYSLAGCLLIYGCERISIVTHNFVTQTEVDAMSSRRKLSIRGSEVEDPIFIDPTILSCLMRYMESNLDEITCLTAKFIHLFLVESRFLETFEFDNFIVRNVKLIAACVWAAYGVQKDDLASVRTHLLVRHLLVDTQSFEEIVSVSCNSGTSTVEQRLSAVNRLFRIVVDVTSPAFAVEGRQWRSSVIELFHRYFSCMWLDPAEEVRLSVKVSSATLLPAHFDIISGCWNEAFSKSPINERIRLVGFLIQLRPYLPAWKVLSWEVIIETLAESDNSNGHMNLLGDLGTSDKEHLRYHMMTADPDMDYLRGAVLHLSLQMLSDGIGIDSFSLMKLKVQFVRFMGFNNISVMPTPNHQSFYLNYGDIGEVFESSFSCIEQLPHVVDCPHSINLPHSALGITTEHDNKTSSVLVGSVFVDAILCIVCTLQDLPSLPVLTLKSILESLYIIIQKYDFEDALFRQLRPLLRRAILRIMELLSKTDISYELRLLVLTIVQATIRRFYAFLGSSLPLVLDIVIAEVAAHDSQSQDPLVVQGKFFIVSTITTFCHHGLLFSMMKRPLQTDFFHVLKQAFASENKESDPSPDFVCEALLRDTLLRIADAEPAFLQTLLQNMSTFIEDVYLREYNVELTIFIGQQLAQIVRRMSDGTFEGADPSSIILISALLLQRNKKQFKEFIPYVDTVLRTSLNRLNVDATTLTRLIRAALPMQPKSSDSSAGSGDIIYLLVEVLTDGLRMKTKMSPLTISSLIEALLSADLYFAVRSRIRSQPVQDLVDDSFMFLQNHLWTEDNINYDFKGVTAAATLFLNETSRSNNVFQKFIEPISEKSGRLPLGFRSWNILLLVALQEEKEDWKSTLLSHFHGFSNLFANVMRSYSSTGINSLVVATSDLNLSHIAMKLWLMLSASCSQTITGQETSSLDVWNELWFAYEGFLDVLDMEGQVGLYPTLISLATASVADLILYINSLRSQLALDKHTHMAILQRMKMMSRSDSSSSKVVRAVESLSEPSEVVRTSFLDQIAKELVAAEKIRIAESKRTGDYGRFIGGERLRKEGR